MRFSIIPLKAWRIKYVFKRFLKEFKESAFLKDGGMLFHNLGPAIENLRSSLDLSLDLGT